MGAGLVPDRLRQIGFSDPGLPYQDQRAPFGEPPEALDLDDLCPRQGSGSVFVEVLEGRTAV